MMKEWKNPPPSCILIFRVALSCPLAATTFDTHYSVSFSFSDATLFTSHRVSNPQVSKSVSFSRSFLKLLSARIIYFSLRGKSRAYTAYIVCVVYVICARLNNSSSRGRATTGPAARWAFVFFVYSYCGPSSSSFHVSVYSPFSFVPSFSFQSLLSLSLCRLIWRAVTTHCALSIRT